MLVALPPLAAAAALAAYFLTTFRLARYRRAPWEFLAVMAAATGVAIYQLLRAPGVGTAVGAVLTAGIFVFSCWFLFSFTMYGAREDRPRVGDRLPDFTLPTSEGSAFSLAAARGRKLLVVCYRGGW